jgi:hypothetical protein
MEGEWQKMAGQGVNFELNSLAEKHCKTQQPTYLFATSQGALLSRAGSRRHANLQLKSPPKCRDMRGRLWGQSEIPSCCSEVNVYVPQK